MGKRWNDKWSGDYDSHTVTESESVKGLDGMQD